MIFGILAAPRVGWGVLGPWWRPCFGAVVVRSPGGWCWVVPLVLPSGAVVDPWAVVVPPGALVVPPGVVVPPGAVMVCSPRGAVSSVVAPAGVLRWGCCEVLYSFWWVRYCYSGLGRAVFFLWPCIQGFCGHFGNWLRCFRLLGGGGGGGGSSSDAPCPPLFSFGCWCFGSPFSFWWLFTWLVWALLPRRLRKVPSPLRGLLVLTGVENCNWSLCSISLQREPAQYCGFGGGVFVYTAIFVTSLAMSLIIFRTLVVLLAVPVIWNMRWSSSVSAVLVSTLYSVLSFLILSPPLSIILLATCAVVDTSLHVLLSWVSGLL